MTPDGFSLIETLIGAWGRGINAKIKVEDGWHDLTPDNMLAKVDDEWVSLRKAVQKVSGDGDEYHTLDELYEYRMLYNAAFAYCGQTDFEVVKSYRHFTGELCFDGGWFIVTMDLPTGQVSNHYENKHWDLFRVPAVERAPEWDGHTPEEAADRLRRYCMGEQ